MKAERQSLSADLFPKKDDANTVYYSWVVVHCLHVQNLACGGQRSLNTSSLDQLFKNLPSEL